MKRKFLTYKEIHLNNFEDEERYDVRTQTNDNSNKSYWKERDEGRSSRVMKKFQCRRIPFHAP